MVLNHLLKSEPSCVSFAIRRILSYSFEVLLAVGGHRDASVLLL